MMKLSPSLLAAALALVVVTATKADGFSASFSWAGIPACEKVSPAITLSAVPLGTKRLRMFMTDLDTPMFHHGGSVIGYYGDVEIKRGAIGYIGPCPPAGEHHRYTWTIEALDADGKTVGTTNVTQTFPP